MNNKIRTAISRQKLFRKKSEQIHPNLFNPGIRAKLMCEFGLAQIDKIK